MHEKYSSSPKVYSGSSKFVTERVVPASPVDSLQTCLGPPDLLALVQEEVESAQGPVSVNGKHYSALVPSITSKRTDVSRLRNSIRSPSVHQCCKEDRPRAFCRPDGGLARCPTSHTLHRELWRYQKAVKSCLSKPLALASFQSNRLLLFPYDPGRLHYIPSQNVLSKLYTLFFRYSGPSRVWCASRLWLAH